VLLYYLERESLRVGQATAQSTLGV
jgi:hypothetical protein